MCTVVTLFRPGHPVPLLLAANRDEMILRAWDPPAAYWPEQPDVVAGRDRSGGGTWMGINRAGVVAAVLNRQGSLGPAPGKHSRGELPLLALREASAAAVAQAVSRLDAGLWRSFNMVLADRGGTFFARGLGYGAVMAEALPAGLHMVTSRDPNDLQSPRVRRHLPRLRAAAAPDTDGWATWRAVIADRSGAAGEQMNVVPRGGFGTVCSSLVELREDGGVSWLFAAGAPDEVGFELVALAGGVGG